MCFTKSFASHEKAKYWSDDNTVTPREVFKSSSKKYIFNCDNCKHAFASQLSNVQKSSNCCYCCEPPKELCENMNCNLCFEKSFASHEKAKYWGDNNNITPREVFKSSNDEYIFNCNICYHQFAAKLDRVKRGQWCPFCSHDQLCEFEDCSLCLENSFSSHEKSKYWSEDNDTTPRMVFKSSGKYYNFDCNKCNHKFSAQPSSIKYNHWCQYCVHQKLCEQDDCEFCFENSFASHEKAKYWSDSNIQSPRSIFKKSGGDYEFKLECGHQTTININHLRKSNQCRKCDSCPSCQLWLTYGKLCQWCIPKSQNKLYQKTKEMDVVRFLKEKLPDIDFIHNKSVGSECTGAHLFPDILVDCDFYYLIVEIDEHKHSGANYACDKKRMYDIIAKRGMPCIFIRYNPDNKLSDKNILLDTVKSYLNLDNTVWDDFGFKCKYLFY